MSEKIYLPCSAKSRDNNFGETEIRLGLNVAKLGAFCKEHKNEGGYVNLIIAPRKSVGEYGDTHSVVLDTWVPGEKTKTKAKPSTTKSFKKPAAAPKTEAVTAEVEGDEPPF